MRRCYSTLSVTLFALLLLCQPYANLGLSVDSQFQSFSFRGRMAVGSSTKNAARALYRHVRSCLIDERNKGSASHEPTCPLDKILPDVETVLKDELQLSPKNGVELIANALKNFAPHLKEYFHTPVDPSPLVDLAESLSEESNMEDVDSNLQKVEEELRGSMLQSFGISSQEEQSIKGMIHHMGGQAKQLVDATTAAVKKLTQEKKASVEDWDHIVKLALGVHYASSHAEEHAELLFLEMQSTSQTQQRWLLVAVMVLLMFASNYENGAIVVGQLAILLPLIVVALVGNLVVLVMGDDPEPIEAALDDAGVQDGPGVIIGPFATAESAEAATQADDQTSADSTHVCVVCMSHKPNVRYDCGHLNMCSSCAFRQLNTDLEGHDRRCLMCRQVVTDFARLPVAEYEGNPEAHPHTFIN
eukprot:GILJ01009829.1.p1 GENE.GILJ01009829.1~~GILJ01009829.1.p1  ORF type:complete len:416 (-),score=64.13 GILJ01009829.1:149-1396(-)